MTKDGNGTNDGLGAMREPKRRSRFDAPPPQQPQGGGGGWGQPPPQQGGWGNQPPQQSGGWGATAPPSGGGWGNAPPPAQGGGWAPPQGGGYPPSGYPPQQQAPPAPREDPRIAAAKRAAAAASVTGPRPPPQLRSAPPNPASPRANDPRARAPKMPSGAPKMPSNAPRRDAWDGVGAPPPVPLPPAETFTESAAARQALERMGAAPPPAPPPAPAPAPPAAPAANSEDAEKAARARVKEVRNAGTDEYQKQDFKAALSSYEAALQLLDEFKKNAPATSSRVNAARDERRQKVLSCLAKVYGKLGDARAAKEAVKKCDKIEKRLSEYKRRARK